MPSTEVRIAYLKRLIARAERERARIQTLTTQGQIRPEVAKMSLRALDLGNKGTRAQLRKLEREHRAKLRASPSR